MKHLKTLIALFLLVIGTSASRAEFKDVTLDFTMDWAASLSTGGSPSMVYVTDIVGGVPTLTETKPAEYMAYILGYYKNSSYGLYYNAKVQVPVPAGNYKVVLGMNDYGGEITVTDGTNELATIDSKGDGTKKYAVGHENVASKVISVTESTTLHIYAKNNGSNVYFPYISVQATTEEPTPQVTEYSVEYGKGTTGAEGVCPSKQTCALGESIYIPKNFTLYKEGYTLTGWTDGTNTYAIDAEVEFTSDMSLTPVFRKNTKSIATCPTEVTVKFDFQQGSGAPSVGYEGATAIWVAQTKVDGEIIDVKADIDATSGKFNNKSWTDWCQVNAGTKFTLPSCNGASISLFCYQATVNTTIDGKDGKGDTPAYTSTGTIAQGTIASTGNSVEVVVGNDAAYLRYIELVIPHIEVVEELNAVWDWKELTADEANFTKGTRGTIKSSIPGVELLVDAWNCAVSYKKPSATAYAEINNFAEIQVPVRRVGDQVTVTSSKSYPNLKVGDTAVGANNTFTYTATQEDAENGYVAITSDGRAYIYKIELKQVAFSDVLPVITINSQGWATFCCLNKGVVVKLPRLNHQTLPQAYIAKKIDTEKKQVTLSDVNTFGYGEGVIIKGAPGAKYYAQIVNATSDVKNANNIIRGCTESTLLAGDGSTYIFATKTLPDGTKKTGFYNVDDDVTVPAGKAFLYIEDSTGAKEYTFVFEGQEVATGVTSVAKETKSAEVYYNLAGQKVGKNYKGIVIGADGVKKLVK